MARIRRTEVVAAGGEVPREEVARTGGGSPETARSSIGSTSGRPRRRAQTRLAVALAEVRVAGVGHPVGPAARDASRTFGSRSGEERDARLDRDGVAILLVVDPELGPGLSAMPFRVVLDLPEIGGQAPEVGPLPGLEGVVVALGTVDPDPEEGPRHPGGQAFGVIGLLRRGPG